MPRDRTFRRDAAECCKEKGDAKASRAWVLWLGRRGLLREADVSNEAPSYSARKAMTSRTLETAKDTGEPAEPERDEPSPRVTDAAVHERCNLHASVHVPAHDDRHRLAHCARATDAVAADAGRGRRRGARPTANVVERRPGR